MKILIVTGIFPPDIGGPATYVAEMAKAFMQKGHQITVVTTSEPAWLDSDDSKYPFLVLRMNRRMNLGWRPFYFTKTIFHYVRKADVVLANGVFLEATVASLLAGKSIVHKIVGDPSWERARNRDWTRDSFEVFQKTRYGFKLESLRKLRTFVARRANKIIVPSRYLATWVGRWGIPRNKLLVIYNSVPPLDLVVPKPIPLTSPVKLVTACRLVSWKGVDSIIQATRQMENVGLLICGDGPERSNLERLARDLGLTDRIHFAGQRERRDTLALMAGCDIFVLNSTYEGFPHVVLEAMSLGLPVISTSVGGIPELVRNGKTGILINSSDPEVLRLAILQLTDSPETRQKMRTNGRSFVEKFAFSKMVDQTEDALLSVTKQYPPTLANKNN